MRISSTSQSAQPPLFHRNTRRPTTPSSSTEPQRCGYQLQEHAEHESSSIPRHPKTWPNQHSIQNPNTNVNSSTTVLTNPNTDTGSDYKHHRYGHHKRIHPFAAFQSYVTLLLTLLLIYLRHASYTRIQASVLHQNIQFHVNDTSKEQTIHFHFLTVPKPFVGNDGVNQIRALQSWLALTPKPKITLLGNVDGIRTISRKYSVSNYQRIDSTFLNIPIVSSIIYTISKLCVSNNNTFCIFLNADIILFDDFTLALRKIYYSEKNNNWMAIGARWDIHNFYNGNRNVRNKVNYIRNNGNLRTFGGIDCWAWHSNVNPFKYLNISPFILGRGKYDNWLTHVLIYYNHQNLKIIDISQAVTITHIMHDHHLIVDNNHIESHNNNQEEFWSSNDIKKTFEVAINNYLSFSSEHYNYTSQLGTILHAPYKLVSCIENIPLCLIRRKRPHACRCEHSPFVQSTLTDPFINEHSTTIICGLLSINDDVKHEHNRWSKYMTGYNNMLNSNKLFGLPLTKSDIIKSKANSRDQTIILMTADGSNVNLVFESVCWLRYNNLFDNFLVVALDDETYKFCITHGIAVYLADYDDTGFNDHVNFRELAHLQSIYEILTERKCNILSISPGTIIKQSPWTYLNSEYFGRNTDLAFIPGEVSNDEYTTSIANDDDIGLGRDKASISALFIKPTKGAIALLKDVMGEMELKAEQASEVMWRFACRGGILNRNQNKKMQCVYQNSNDNKLTATIHLLDTHTFRSIAVALKRVNRYHCTGIECTHEFQRVDKKIIDESIGNDNHIIAFLPYGFQGTRASNADVMQAIRLRKMSRSGIDNNYCVYSRLSPDEHRPSTKM